MAGPRAVILALSIAAVLCMAYALPSVEQIRDDESSHVNARKLLENVKFTAKQLPTMDARLSYASKLLNTMDHEKLVHLFAEAMLIDNDCFDNCVFGELTAQRLLFLIDVSPSMYTPFKLTSGRNTTRLQYVKEQLIGFLTKQLTPDRTFQVFAFDANVYPMWTNNRFVNATQRDIDVAVQWVKSLKQTAQGGTDIYKVISTAYKALGPSYLNSSAVFLLSDGNAGTGITNLTIIANDAGKWANEAIPHIPTHTFSFTAGNVKDYNPSYSEDKEQSRLCMREIAAATGGVYHAYE